jgi:hypothetical protein
MGKHSKIEPWLVAFLSDRGRGLACEISNFPEIVPFIGWRRNHRRCGTRRSCVCTLTFLRRCRCIHHASEIDGSSSGTNCSVKVDVLVGPGRWSGGGDAFDYRFCNSILDYLFWCALLCVGHFKTQTGRPGNNRVLRSMPGGQHKFEFRGYEPLALWIVAALLFANTALMLLLEFGRKHIVPQHAPEMADWYASNSIAIQFVLLAVLAAIFLTFRKRVRYIPQK